MITAKVRAKLRPGHVKARLKAGSNKALDRCGSIVRRSAQRQFSVRAYRKKPIWKRVGEFNGLPLVSMSFQDSKPGKVTSWKPKAFLRSKILYSRDDRKSSVVIGPDDKVKNVQILHERGGAQGVKLVLIRPTPTDSLMQYKVPNSMLGSGAGRRRDKRGRFLSTGQAYVGRWVSTGKRVKGRVAARDPGRAPAGRFMEKGLAEKRAKLPEQFKNRISGP